MHPAAKKSKVNLGFNNSDLKIYIYIYMLVSLERQILQPSSQVQNGIEQRARILNPSPDTHSQTLGSSVFVIYFSHQNYKYSVRIYLHTHTHIPVALSHLVIFDSVSCSSTLVYQISDFVFIKNAKNGILSSIFFNILLFLHRV